MKYRGVTANGKHVGPGGRELKFARTLLAAPGRDDLSAHAGRPAGEQGN